MGAAAQRDGAQRARGEGVQPGGRCALLARQPLGGLEHRAGGGVAAVVGDDIGGEGLHGVHLGDGVEIAPRMQLHIHIRERFEPSAEFGPGPPHPLGDRANQPVLAGQQRDDAVRLAQLVLAQHHRMIPIQPHRNSLACGTDRAVTSRRACAD